MVTEWDYIVTYQVYMAGKQQSELRMISIPVEKRITRYFSKEGKLKTKTIYDTQIKRLRGSLFAILECHSSSKLKITLFILTNKFYTDVVILIFLFY